MFKMQQNETISQYLIKTAWWTNENGDSQRKVDYTDINNEERMYYEDVCYGDYSIGYVVVEKNGREVERHNIKFIASIIWSDILN